MKLAQKFIKANIEYKRDASLHIPWWGFAFSVFPLNSREISIKLARAKEKKKMKEIEKKRDKKETE
jgi:hypothetical protein